MTVPEFIALANGVTYKPGEKLLAVYDHPGDFMRIRLLFKRTVPDSKKPGQPIDITHQRAFTEREIDQWDEDQSKAVIHAHIRDAELHECDEFLMFHGEQYRDPHAGDQRVGR